MTAGPESGAACILVVDDSLFIRTAVCEYLASAGYRVLQAEDGYRAVELFREHAGDIAGVLLDEEMPAMDGHTALRLLRAIDPAVRVVCMSGGGAPPDDPGGAGTVRPRFLPKPFRFPDLLVQVRCLVGQQPG